MHTPILIDSDVLVWLTRGTPGAAQRLKKGLAAHDTEVLPITPDISKRAADLIDTLALSHGMRLADALIGATAIEHDLMLLTANVKHFGSTEGLRLEAVVP